VDELLDRYGVCHRGADGFLHAHGETDPREFLAKNAQIWSHVETEGFVDGAVDALRRWGYDAWKNPAGDVAVRPPVDFMF
jgi:hypothetical protein